MKLGVLTNLLGSVSLEEALKYFSSLGLEMVEIGCGGYPGNAHANPDILLNDDKALEYFVGKVVPSLSEIKENGTSGLGAKMADNFKAAVSDLKKRPQQPQNRSFLGYLGFGR